MKTFTRDELVVKAAEIFARPQHEKETSILACTDGQFMITNESSRGSLSTHCKELGLEYFEISRAEAATVVKNKPLEELTLKELKELATAKSIEFKPTISKTDLLALLTPVEAKTEAEKETETKTEE